VAFLERADYRFIGLQCECCDSQIEAAHQIYFDIDGERGDDGYDRTRITVLHAWCMNYVRRAQAASRAAALFESAQAVRASASIGEAHGVLMCRVRDAHKAVIEAAA
jgi:hypothetical protein